MRYRSFVEVSRRSRGCTGDSQVLSESAQHGLHDSFLFVRKVIDLQEGFANTHVFMNDLVVLGHTTPRRGIEGSENEWTLLVGLQGVHLRDFASVVLNYIQLVFWKAGSRAAARRRSPDLR